MAFVPADTDVLDQVFITVWIFGSVLQDNVQTVILDLEWLKIINLWILKITGAVLSLTWVPYFLVMHPWPFNKNYLNRNYPEPDPEP